MLRRYDKDHASYEYDSSEEEDASGEDVASGEEGASEEPLADEEDQPSEEDAAGGDGEVSGGLKSQRKRVKAAKSKGGLERTGKVTLAAMRS